MFQEYPYGPVPPATVKSIEPVEFPVHNTLTCVVVADNGAAGSVIVTVAVIVQLLWSVTVTVYVPACKFDKSSVVWLGVVFHE